MCSVQKNKLLVDLVEDLDFLAGIKDNQIYSFWGGRQYTQIDWFFNLQLSLGLKDYSFFHGFLIKNICLKASDLYFEYKNNKNISALLLSKIFNVRSGLIKAIENYYKLKEYNVCYSIYSESLKVINNIIAEEILLNNDLDFLTGEIPLI